MEQPQKRTRKPRTKKAPPVVEADPVNHLHDALDGFKKGFTSLAAAIAEIGKHLPEFQADSVKDSQK